MEREAALRIIEAQSGGLVDPYVLQRFHRMLARQLA
jgi:response regulator RpfG family c-di-GMP phosphodiesterase